jgi:hypothetical protein
LPLVSKCERNWPAYHLFSHKQEDWNWWTWYFFSAHILCVPSCCHQQSSNK